MQRKNEHYAYFTVVGDFDPEAITRRLGLEPTSAWLKGSQNHLQLERNHSRRSLESRLAWGEALELHIVDVFERMAPRRGAFRSLVDDLGGCMQLVGYFWEFYPGLHLDAAISKEIGFYGLSVDFDFYGLYSPRLDDTAERKG